MHLVGLYTYCRMMHGAYSVKSECIQTYTTLLQLQHIFEISSLPSLLLDATLITIALKLSSLPVPQTANNNTETTV